MPPERSASGIDIHVIPGGGWQLLLLLLLLRGAADTLRPRPALPAGPVPHPAEVPA